jgi:hypothetical protein
MTNEKIILIDVLEQANKLLKSRPMEVISTETFEAFANITYDIEQLVESIKE